MQDAGLLLRTVQLVTGENMDDVVRTALHRPEFWGRPFLAGPARGNARPLVLPGIVLR